MLAVVTTVPAWFIWPGEPVMEAVDAVVIAGLLLILWVRDLLGMSNVAFQERRDPTVSR